MKAVAFCTWLEVELAPLREALCGTDAEELHADASRAATTTTPVKVRRRVRLEYVRPVGSISSPRRSAWGSGVNAATASQACGDSSGGHGGGNEVACGGTGYASVSAGPL